MAALAVQDRPLLVRQPPFEKLAELATPVFLGGNEQREVSLTIVQLSR